MTAPDDPQVIAAFVERGHRARAMAGVRSRRKHGANGLSKIQLKWISPPKGLPWARLFIDVLDGEAWRGLSVNARRVLDALICQHFRYCQRENGDLQISPCMITPALRELKEADLVETKQGVACNGIMRPPTLYELTMYRPKNSFQKEASRRFVWVPIEVMESAEWCSLSINARRIMDRLLIENALHKSAKNGQLRVSFRQFVGHGVGMRLIGSALKELLAAELLNITTGKPRGSLTPPNLYSITFLGTADNPATWRKLETNVVTLPKSKERKAKPKAVEKLFSAPISCSGKGRLPPLEGEASYIFSLPWQASGVAAPSQPAANGTPVAASSYRCVPGAHHTRSLGRFVCEAVESALASYSSTRTVAALA